MTDPSTWSGTRPDRRLDEVGAIATIVRIAYSGSASHS